MTEPARLHPQAGVIPCRRRDDAIEVLLVTSATRRRWIIPKGNIEPHLDMRDSARLEAYEEAGVVGHIHLDPVGSYLHDRGKRAPTSVQVFLMEVERELPPEGWPEHRHRERRWMELAEAREAVLEDGLKQLFTRVPDLLQ